MRKIYVKQLDDLHTRLIHMGALCEDAIASAAKGLLEDNDRLREKAAELEIEINIIEREIERRCARLLLHQQPVAGDLRRVTAAQRMIVDMERIGDQARDIAELSGFMKNSAVKSDAYIGDMARAAIKMVTDSVSAFVSQDIILAEAVIKYDDIVDELFANIKNELIDKLQNERALAGDCLDLLMIAKYFERIGDHAVNLAEEALYFLTGSRKTSAEE